MARAAEENLTTPHTTGSVLHWAVGYDLLVWLVTLGRERAFRERLLGLAHLRPGESILDVGCGTGTLAIAAKRLVGTNGSIYGIDASAEMIDRARKKAKRAGLDVTFKNAVVEALPFPDAQFDIVLSTLMVHHLGRKARRQGAREIRRVLKPNGRVLVVDFGAPQKRHGFIAHFHRHGYVDVREILALLGEAGLTAIESGAVGTKDLQFVLASPSPASRQDGMPLTDLPVKRDSRLLTRGWIVPAVVIAIIAGHAVVPYMLLHLRVSAAIISSAVVLVAVAHLGVAGAAIASLTTLLRKRSGGTSIVRSRLRRRDEAAERPGDNSA